LPDKKEKDHGGSDAIEAHKVDTDEERADLLNAAKIVFSSPNPNFIILDKEILQSFETSPNDQLTADKALSEKHDIKNAESDA
jgi:hypothetical protein